MMAEHNPWTSAATVFLTLADHSDMIGMITMSKQAKPGQPAFYGAVTVGARGQIVVPQRLREELGIAAGEQLLVLKGPRPGSFLVQRADVLLAGLDPPAGLASAPAPAGVPTPPDEERSELERELAALPVFGGLSPAALARLAALARPRHYDAGAFIVREDEPCVAMYVIRSGLIRRLKTSAEGREQVLALLGPSEAFNEVPIFDGGPNPASAQAVQPSDLYEFLREDVTALMASDPAVSIGLTRTLAVRLRQLTGVIEDLSFRQVAGRIANLLLNQADGKLPASRISQQEMAAMVGTAREVVGRALHSLEAAGAIRLEHGRVVIRDRARLESYV